MYNRFSSVFAHSTEAVEEEGEGEDRKDVLLVAVLVPVLSVLVLAALLVPVMVGGWRLWAKRCALVLSSPPPTSQIMHVYPLKYYAVVCISGICYGT